MPALLLSLILLVFPKQIHAIYDPVSVANNKYGVLIADFSDIPDVAPLVNSTGGDWGYITLVASDNDRDSDKWQGYFDQMRRLHLIPLVRIATHVEKDHWVKPNPEKFDELVAFFNSLNWPTENRYVILYNEPNHAKEWSDAIDPEGYAQVFVDLGRKFKEASDDFFLLPAGLDVSAGTDNLSLDAAEYLRRMITSQPDVLTLMDGWNSHSYPNPGFSGLPFAVGRGTLRSYAWELSYLESRGLSRNLPVFITETGWAHGEGKSFQGGLLSSEDIGRYMQTAAQGVWSDPRIVAITPFVFNYQDVPFDTFSWKRLSRDGGGYYPQYEAYKGITKPKGQPRQEEAYELTDQLLPPTLVAGSTYTLAAQITNKGQGILSPSGEYELIFEEDNQSFALIADTLPTIEPGEKGELTLQLKAPQQPGTYRAVLGIRRFDQIIPLQTQDIHIVPPPSLTIQAPLGWRRAGEAQDVTVLVYDNTKLLHKYPGLSLKDGQVTVIGLTGILPGRPYRVVILVPYYLPRQVIVPLESTHTLIIMKRLLPLDFNRDGALRINDIIPMFRAKPNFIFSLFFGP